VIPAVTAPPINPREKISFTGMVFVQRGKILRIKIFVGEKEKLLKVFITKFLNNWLQY
jgi:ribosomal protein L21E